MRSSRAKLNPLSHFQIACPSQGLRVSLWSFDEFDFTSRARASSPSTQPDPEVRVHMKKAHHVSFSVQTTHNIKESTYSIVRANLIKEALAKVRIGFTCGVSDPGRRSRS